MNFTPFSFFDIFNQKINPISVRTLRQERYRGIDDTTLEQIYARMKKNNTIGRIFDTQYQERLEDLKNELENRRNKNAQQHSVPAKKISALYRYRCFISNGVTA